MKAQNKTIEILEPKAVAKTLHDYAPALSGKVIDTNFFLSQALKRGKKILFEGSQALGLDNHWGTYPYVTSGNAVVAGASIGTGLPMDAFKASIMVVKTLPTRVGRRPFVSEMWDRQKAMAFAQEHKELFVKGEKRDKFLLSKLERINQGKSSRAEMSQYFQVLGDERGATTGRGRSVGFLDVPWLLYAVRINNPKFLALTRFDMLSGVKIVPVAVGYKYQGKVLPKGQLPAPWNRDKVKPVFEKWQGFTEDISGINKEKNLPLNARKFFARLERLLGVKILFVGTCPGREDVVIRA